MGAATARPEARILHPGRLVCRFFPKSDAPGRRSHHGWDLKAELILAYLISFHFGLQVRLAFATAVFLFSGRIVEQKHPAKNVSPCVPLAHLATTFMRFANSLAARSGERARERGSFHQWWQCHEAHGAPVEGQFFHT